MELDVDACLECERDHDVVLLFGVPMLVLDAEVSAILREFDMSSIHDMLSLLSALLLIWSSCAPRIGWKRSGTGMLEEAKY